MEITDLPPVPGVEHREVEVRGVRLHLAEAGDGPPLLLLHGWPQHWWSWRRLIPPLAEEYRVLVPDLRGWGWSDAPAGRYFKTEFVADVLGLLDSLGLDRVKVVGHDWGGWTAFLLALEHPERVERMVTLDIPPPWMGRPSLRQLTILPFLSYQVLVGSPGLGPRTMTASNRFIRAIIRGGSGRGAHWTPEELDAYATVLRDPARARASSACYRTFLTSELPKLMRGYYRPSQLTVPTLLLMGGQSFLQRGVPAAGSPNLEVQSIAGVGHFLPEEAPSEVLERARPFLAGS